MAFLILFAIPVFIAFGFFIVGGRNITWQEFLAQVGLQAIVAGASVGIMYWADTTDTEVWSGVVTSKAREIVSCSHSYSCNCRTVCSSSGKSTSCSTVCDTCYEHSYDVSWAYYTTDDGRGTISRVDRQGLSQPARWTQVQIGEPSASTHTFTNYIKAAPDTLFRSQGLVEQYLKLLPNYPGQVYDYYKLNRLVTVGVSVPNINVWNNALQQLNAQLGSKKQVNMVVVLVKGQPREYFGALQQHWLGGKKNDAVLVVDIDTNGAIDWVEVMAWTDHPEFKIKLRDATADLSKLDLNNPNQLLNIFSSYVDSFYVRKHMKDFQYLTSSITPTTTEWIVSIIIGILSSVGLGVFFYKNDIWC